MMKIKEQLLKYKALEKQLTEVSQHLEKLEYNVYSFEGVPCYIEGILNSTTQIELLVINGSTKKFRNDSNCMFVSVEEFESNAIILKM